MELYLITYSENGKPYTLPSIPNKTVLRHLVNLIFHNAIQGLYEVSHLTIKKYTV